MMDLHDQLEKLAGPGVAPTPDDIDADLTRGRRALRRRRNLRAGAATAFAAAGLAAVVSFTGVGAGLTGNHPGGATVTAAHVQLVAYTGRQPKGFTVDRVPDGWFVQGSDDYALTIAPGFARNPGPNVDPSKSPVYDPHDFRDKVVVTLESKDSHGPQGGRTVQIGGRNGVLVLDTRGMMALPNGKLVEEPARPDGDYGGTVWVRQSSGVYLIVQFWEGLGFTPQQMVDLTAGVHVHADAIQSVG